MTIEELIRDKTYITELLNGPCIPKDEEGECAPLNPDWIDEELSARVTEVFHRLMPENVPYLTYILVERDPDTMYEGTGVDDDSKRMRYIVISLIPDTERPYDYSFPLIHEMWIVSLHCREIIRAALAAAEADRQVGIVTDPVPPILNNARIAWVSLYLGKKPYRGISMLSDQWAETEKFGGYEHDVNLYKVREMEATPLLQRLIDAYDEEYSKEGDRA